MLMKVQADIYLTHWHAQQSVPLLLKRKSLESIYGHSTSLTYRLSLSLQEKDMMMRPSCEPEAELECQKSRGLSP